MAMIKRKLARAEDELAQESRKLADEVEYSAQLVEVSETSTLPSSDLHPNGLAMCAVPSPHIR
jgi:hypothetical protein